MSDQMTPMPFAQLMNWILKEYKNSGTVFGQHKFYKADGKHNRKIFNRTLETPVGPAAGPNTQLAQNIAAAYYTGSRFFELKTVQVIDGRELAACVSKPCILADDEGYNCEWSTELYVEEAEEEYIKAWFLLKFMAKEFELGSMDGFLFNISVGYDLAGIQSEKIDHFLNTMKEAKDSKIFKECTEYLLDHVSEFTSFTEEDVCQIQSQICSSVTISTLHGCPPQEIERIARYLMKEKGFHTFVKCNPTLLGYEYARQLLDEMGYDYLVFGEFHFKDDLQYKDAVPMFTRLRKVAAENNLEFGVKLTNTFPVDVTRGELPSKEMYMSGKALFPLTVSLALKLTEQFHGNLRISYSGGADYFNIREIVDAGIWPVTVATTLLKPGGYQRMIQMAEVTEGVHPVFTKVDGNKLRSLLNKARKSRHYRKALKPLSYKKIERKVPLTDCFTAPCKEGCPIHQDITAYLHLVGEGRYKEAMEVIMEKNPLPFITGTICAHNCMKSCTRNFYEEPVDIRKMKLIAAEKGYEKWLAEQKVPEIKYEGKAAVIGGGPAGMSAAYFLRRAGMKVTIFEKNDRPGGVVEKLIPSFRISEDAVGKDVKILEKIGVDIKTNTKISSLKELRGLGFTSIVLCVGASVPGRISLEKGEALDAQEFLEDFKKSAGNLDLGRNIVVIGGGNTAIDTARAAVRNKNVEHVFLVYRRTKREMPADEEELFSAMEEGVEWKELLSPVRVENKGIVLEKMEFQGYESSGRRAVRGTGTFCTLAADTVISAVGEKVPTDFYRENGLKTKESGKLVADEKTLQTSIPDVYAAGDGLYGPSTVVEAVRDGRKAAEAIMKKALCTEISYVYNEDSIYKKRGILKEAEGKETETDRCLECSGICENCVEVCPNRANIMIYVKEMKRHQILHLDYLCNECGNCKTFCPYLGAPYLDKFTLFADREDLENSSNEGFSVVDRSKHTFFVRYQNETFLYKDEKDKKLPEELKKLIKTVAEDYTYLLP